MKNTVLKILATAAFATVAAASAFAADMAPRYTKAPPPVVVYNWTGFYIGGNAGYSWGRANNDATFYNANVVPNLFAGTANSSYDMNGWVAGGQAGYNWQVKNWVFGLEGDIQATGQKGSTDYICAGAICSPGQTAIPVVNSTVSVHLDQKLEWFSTVRARGGVTFTPTVLGYVTGGLAIGEVKTDATVIGRTNAVGAPFVTTITGDRDTRVGWTVGAGLEASLGGNWTGKVEYLYLDLGRQSFTAVNLLNATPLRVDLSTRITDHIGRVGINYRFGGPVVAKY